jgi:4-diphosphocytidyl-2-C-methyl-D-erythritol kinase
MNGAFGQVEDRDWVAIARQLGSDVPFFLTQSGALVEGTGERVTAVGALPIWHVVVAKPPCAVSTTAAFKELDGRPRPSRPRSASISLEALDALQRGDFREVIQLLSNDFHDVIAAEHDDVAKAIDALRAAGATKPLLSGSGSAVFALEETALAADAVMKALSVASDFRVFRAMLRNSGSWRR